MPKKIPEHHSLRKIFRSATNFGFWHSDLRDREAASYISDEILVEFTYVDNLYKIRNAKGKRLEDIAEMLIEGELPNMNVMDYYEGKRAFYKHIGDYALFITGLFPESLKGMKETRHDYILGSLIIPTGNPLSYYMERGKRAYKEVSAFYSMNEREEALFRRLAEKFYNYMCALNLARAYLDSLKNKDYQQIKRILLE
ncbi:MAG TPA: hypothetical protein EYP60_04450 [bacterium (Candidatus Stahlbacteria)]|nr:hypothetical protein [Candidatus Stahlbacteria bacterium]